jgi:CubicO group peptidase (beta-lactamase class C family)
LIHRKTIGLLVALVYLAFSITGMPGIRAFSEAGDRTPIHAADELAERIRRIENGLRLPVFLKGQPASAYKLSDRMVYYKTPGVSIAVINRGEIEWAKGYGVLETGSSQPVTADTLFQAASISKPVATFGALRLVQEGKLSLDEDVNKKLVSWKVPENEFTKDQKVTLRRLLSHSAGMTVHGFRGYASDEPVPSLLEVLDGKKPANSAPVRVDIVPGSTWRYSGGGISVAQQLMIDETGTPFPEFMRRTVLGPIGMARSTYEQPLPSHLRSNASSGHRSDGNMVKGKWHTYPEMAAAGLWTTPSDLARFAIEIQKSRRGESNKVLSPDMVGQMLTVQKGSYGLGIGLNGTGKELEFSHGGANEGFRCMLVAFADLGIGAAVMTNSDNGSQLANEILRAISAEYGWPSYKQKERVAVSVDPNILKAYTGKYTLFGQSLETIIEEGRLYLNAPALGLNKAEMYPESDSKFFLVSADVEISFASNGEPAKEITVVLGDQTFNAPRAN